MGFNSIWHWVIVLVLVLLLFGRGKVSELMGDVAKGIKSFKRGMAEDDTPPRPVTHDPAEPVTPERTENKTNVS
jgi:sec-independent protein translocase protein TatA